MRFFLFSSCRITSVLAGLMLVGASALQAQTLREQPTPFSVWLDFQALASASTVRAPLPIWLESVQSETTPAKDGAGERTNFRLRLRRLRSLGSEIQMRLFFQDAPEAAPVVSGWSETGRSEYRSSPLGAGLGLPTSESVTIPVTGLDYIDIEVPGSGRTIRGAFLTTLRKSEVRHSLDFEPLDAVADAFANAPSLVPGPDDAYLYGRVKATLEAGPLKLAAAGAAHETLEFALESQPLIAVITFEVLNADPAFPLQTSVNGQPAVPASMFFPDLADPGYSGSVRPLQQDMRFRYTGWVRAQQIIRGSDLQAGLNRLDFQLNRESGPVAVRAVEIQLKYNWTGLEYELAP